MKARILILAALKESLQDQVKIRILAFIMVKLSTGEEFCQSVVRGVKIQIINHFCIFI
jgi:hypothetical protein